METRFGFRETINFSFRYTFPTEGEANEKTLMGARQIIVVKENLPIDPQGHSSQTRDCSWSSDHILTPVLPKPIENSRWCP